MANWTCPECGRDANAEGWCTNDACSSSNKQPDSAERQLGTGPGTQVSTPGKPAPGPGK
jgi:hypothetical protein